VKKGRLIVIVGPTAVGKTAAAIQLALRLDTEIVSADSRQIYREMKIGTAKPSPEELAIVKHHFIDSQSIHQDYDAGQYGRDALQVIQQLFERHDDVILCGGSGLYIKAVLEGFDDMPDVPAEVRTRITDEYRDKGLIWLQQQVAAKDPDYFSIVDQKNPQRLMRALELYEITKESVLALRKNKKKEHTFDVIKLGLELPREVLYHRIDDRMDQMIQDGLFEEAESLYTLRHLNALQTVGYQEVFDYLSGLYDKEEAVRLLKRNSRRYAKRQLTWFKRDAETVWGRDLNKYVL
jgi:tRNA dimethylallyltransferase